MPRRSRIGRTRLARLVADALAASPHTLERVAAGAGVGVRTLQRTASGDHVPNVGTLHLLAAELELDREQLLAARRAAVATRNRKAGTRDRSPATAGPAD